MAGRSRGREQPAAALLASGTRSISPTEISFVTGSKWSGVAETQSDISKSAFQIYISKSYTDEEHAQKFLVYNFYFSHNTSIKKGSFF